MDIIKDAWKACYEPTKYQQRCLERVYERCNEDEKEAILRFGGHQYAEGWKDYCLHFMAAGAAIGFVIGRIISRR